MHIRCPHCHNAIEVVEHASFKDVECPSCGSSFNLVGLDEATEPHRQKVRTIAHFELIEHLGTGASGSVWKAKRMVILQIQTEEPAPPRRRYPMIPRDLETICLKALNKEPGRRYATAGALADDLQRCLDNKPIKARRVGRFEKSWLWCKRRPVVASLVALVLLIVGIGSGVFIERQNALHSQGLVDSLVKADVGQVSTLMDQIDDYGWWTKPLVEKRVEAAQDDSTEKLHMRLALVHYDASQVTPLIDALLNLRTDQVAYIGVIREALKPYQSDVVGQLWENLHDTSLDEAICYRVALTLAGYQPESEQWSTEDRQFLVEQFVISNPLHHPTMLQLLSEMSADLVDPLEAVFVDGERPENQQIAAANALAFFASKDAPRLATLLTSATGGQYEILYPVFADAADPTVLAGLQSLVKQEPAEELEPAQRIALGRQRAAGAITLLRQGQGGESILDVLRVQDDPEALTQCVHRCRARGITPVQLLELLDHADRLRQAAGDEQRKSEGQVLFGILLALGEFTLAEIPEPRRQPLIDRLEDSYAHDPSSAIHGATGWLLRHWGFEQEAARVDQTPIPYDETGEREWFVLRIDTPAKDELNASTGEKKIYFTFVVFPPGRFLMGSPEGEEYYATNEAIHEVELTRPIAVCDREIVWQQFAPFDGGRHHGAWQRQFSRELSEQEPVFGVNWFEAVAYCRWLTKQAGTQEPDQCYASIPLPAEAVSGYFELPASTNWPLRLDRAGFRLLTEAEWEYVCRSGMRTAYSFGADTGLLGNYAWFEDNSNEWSHAVGQLRPNLRDLLDMHGNLLSGVTTGTAGGSWKME